MVALGRGAQRVPCPATTPPHWTLSTRDTPSAAGQQSRQKMVASTQIPETHNISGARRK